MIEQEAKLIVQRRLKLPERAVEEIDWDVHEGALKRIAPRERKMLKRMLWGKLPTGQKLERNGFRENSKCALCGEDDGTEHFLRCKELRNSEERRIVVGVMKGKLATLGINPYLNHWILTSLSGRTPNLEQERNLRVRERVHRAF